MLQLLAAVPAARAALAGGDSGDDAAGSGGGSGGAGAGADAAMPNAAGPSAPRRSAVLRHALSLLEAPRVPVACRRGVVAALNTLAQADWAGWPSASAHHSVAAALAAGALATLRPSIGATSSRGAIMAAPADASSVNDAIGITTAAAVPAPAAEQALARDCLLLLGVLLFERRTAAGAAGALVDPLSAQRAFAAAAAAAEHPGGAQLRRLGVTVGDMLQRVATALEVQEAREAAVAGGSAPPRAEERKS